MILKADITGSNPARIYANPLDLYAGLALKQRELEDLLQQLNVVYQKIDIAEQEQWQARYAIKIPVLLNSECQQELCWPFTVKDIQALIKEL